MTAPWTPADGRAGLEQSRPLSGDRRAAALAYHLGRALAEIERLTASGRQMPYPHAKRWRLGRAEIERQEEQAMSDDERATAGARETQRSITEWADATFGKPTDHMVLFERMDDEWCELLEKLEADDVDGIAKEAADVYVTMVRWLDFLGYDLHDLVDRKMAVNRARRWRSHGDGTGQHIPEEAP